MHMCTASLPGCKKCPVLEVIQKHISRRTEIKQGQVHTLEIFTSTVWLPDLCINSLITACSSACTRESNHRNNGTKNHSLDIVYFIGFLLCGWPVFYKLGFTMLIQNLVVWENDCKIRYARRLCVYMWTTHVLIINNIFFVFWNWSSGRCGCVSAHCRRQKVVYNYHN